MSKKSTVFSSFVCIVSSASSASESSSSGLPTCFLLPYLLLLGSLLKAAWWAAPNMNVNLFFSSAASSRNSSSLPLFVACGVGRAVFSFCSPYFSSNRFSKSSTLFVSLVSNDLKSSSIFCSILRRVSYSSVVDCDPLRVRVVVSLVYIPGLFNFTCFISFCRFLTVSSLASISASSLVSFCIIRSYLV
jgi:hypothetical protein